LSAWQTAVYNSTGNCKEPQLHAIEASWPAQ